MDFSEQTLKYIEFADLNKRKELGQYFTPQSVIREILQHLPYSKNDGIDILEPSYGTGEFLYMLQEKYPLAKIDAIEYDDILFNISLKHFQNINLINEDTLLYDFKDKKYDLVIGNPPYFEFKISEELKERYKDVITGRINIFNLFVKTGIDLLKPNGYLAFVIPPSMNNGAYFKGLRDYIIKNCDIRDILFKSSDLFHDAQQSVMVLILQKNNNSGRYVFTHAGITIFTKEDKMLEKEFNQLNTYSLKDLGYKVVTGSVVWNQNKEKLSDDDKDTLLIWSHNIQDNKLILNNKPKKQYIKDMLPLKGPAIVVNRVTGSVGTGSLRIAMIEKDKGFLAENHVNVIIPDNNEKQLKTLEEVYINLKNKDNLSGLIQAITGNTQLSKTELERLIPLTF